jgi:cytochrome c biogenesis factor
MKVFINPLQVWLWYGAIIMVLGGIVVAIPVAKTATERVGEMESVVRAV